METSTMGSLLGERRTARAARRVASLYAALRAVEVLEGRLLFAAGLGDDGTLSVSGNDSANVIALSRADRKSTRLNSSHGYISYAVFCLKKKKNKKTQRY